MKKLLFAIIASPLIANAQAVFILNGKEISKLEAVKTLLNQPKAKVIKCNEVELSDKATLKNKKVTM